jgi:hypothetical protein
MSRIHGRLSASRTLSINALRIQFSLASGLIAFSPRRTESSLTIPFNQSACAATASPRTPAMCA